MVTKADEKDDFYVSQRELFPIFEELLKKGKAVRFRISGNSMWPWMIHNRDSVLLKYCSKSSLKRGDIILFQAAKGKYVLHRITRVLKDGYITTGDGNLFRDGYVPKENVKAKVVTIYRKDLEISCNSWKWILISQMWMLAFPIRKYIQMLFRFLARI